LQNFPWGDGRTLAQRASKPVPAKAFGLARLAGWNRYKPRCFLYHGAPRIMRMNLHANATIRRLPYSAPSPTLPHSSSIPHETGFAAANRNVALDRRCSSTSLGSARSKTPAKPSAAVFAARRSSLSDPVSQIMASQNEDGGHPRQSYARHGQSSDRGIPIGPRHRLAQIPAISCMSASRTPAGGVLDRRRHAGVRQTFIMTDVTLIFAL